MILKTDLLSAFVDDLKAHSTFLLALRIVALIVKEWEEVAV